VTLRQLVQGESAPAAGFAALAAALQRVRRIVPAGTPAVLDAQRLTEPAEIDLLEVVTALVRRLASSGADSAVTAETAAGAISLDELVVAAGDLPAAVDAFFDAVMVMADDPAVRAARLGLLAWIRDLTTGALDWEALGSLSASGR
jgi:glycyl-tRNA synthetase